MTAASLEPLLELSRFDGDSVAALRALQAHSARFLPGCVFALMLVRDQAPGSARLAGLIGADGTEHVPNHDPFNARGHLPRFDDALSQALFATAQPRKIVLTPAQRGTPFAQALFAPAAILATPIVNAGEIAHWLLFASTQAERFDAIDLDRVVTQANLAASLVIRQLALSSLTAETTRQRAAMEGLADAQRLLLPDSPRIAGLDFAVHWQPADTAAGDYYDLSNLSRLADPPLPEGSADVWALILADVSGHGAAAAMEGAQFDAILRTYKGDEPPLGPAGALTYANRYFFSRRQRRHFLTAFAMLYEPQERTLAYVCAGHMPALLCRAGEVRALGAGSDAGIPLGILREHRWENVRIEAESGDTLVLYTDGIVEARDPQGSMFGREGLENALGDVRGDSAATLRDRLVAAVQAHQDGPLGVDDQTLLVLRIE